jgi:hypothetical protein
MSCQQNYHENQKSEKLSLKKLYLNSVQFLNIYQIYQIVVEHDYIHIFITYSVDSTLLNILIVHLHQSRCIWVQSISYFKRLIISCHCGYM